MLRQAQRRTSGATQRQTRVSYVPVVAALAGALIGMLGGYLSSSQQIRHDTAMTVRAERRSACTNLYSMAIARGDHLWTAAWSTISSMDAASWKTYESDARAAERARVAYVKSDRDWRGVRAVLLLSSSDRVARAVEDLDSRSKRVEMWVGKQNANALYAPAPIARRNFQEWRSPQSAKERRQQVNGLTNAVLEADHAIGAVLSACKADIAAAS